MKYSLFIATFLLLIVSCKRDGEGIQQTVLSSKIISIAEAHTHLKSEEKIFIHVGNKESYLEDHIPTALQLWRPDYGTSTKGDFRGMKATRSELQELLQKIGFKVGKELLIYDVKGNVDALRFVWVLECHGFQNYRIIDGGLVNWKYHGMETSKEISDRPVKTDYKLESKANKNISASFDEVQFALKDTNTIIVDTREPYEYFAKPFVIKDVLYSYKKGSFERGCIPGAIHLNWSDLVDLKKDHRIKPKEVIAYNLKEKGISADKNVIVYCQSGSRSSHTAFVLREIMGFPSVKNYDGSWIEWTYRNKYLRDTEIQQHTTEEEFRILYNEMEAELKK